jgi:hypothetical protein
MTTTATPASSSIGQSEGKRPLPPRVPRDGGGENSYEDAFDASLFLNEEYVSVSVPFGEVEEEGEGRERFSLDLLCSQAASTDFDLTGQVLWPAAALLASYLVAGEEGGTGEKSRGRSLAARSRSGACELGAGLGLSGLAAVAFSGLRRLVLTDGSDVVLRGLERNARRVATSSCSAEAEEREREVSVSGLEWGDEAAAAALRREHSMNGFDLLLGADVTYSHSALPALFSTAAMLLREREEDEDEEDEDEGERKKEKPPVPTFLLGYVSRSLALDRAVPREAEKAGFEVEVVAGTRRRLPGGQEGWILCLTKKKN